MKNEIENQYNDLLHSVKTEKYYTSVDLTNRVNCYTCNHCGHITKTKDIDPGVTPMFFSCEKCSSMSTSNFYIDKSPNQLPTIEWYRPTLKEVLDMDNNVRDHVLNGGLVHRKILQ